MRLYGLRPWDLPRLTGHELAAVLRDLNAITEGAGDGA